jgi:urease accessory protein
MIRAARVLSGASHPPTQDDVVELDHDLRHRRRIALRSEAGIDFLLDLPEATLLRDGDTLLLEDGRSIAVRAAPESLAEIRATGAAALARIAWHIGNRHLPAAISTDRLLVRRDHVIEAMVQGLGATVRHVSEPFEPEGGAYAHGHAHETGDQPDGDHEEHHDERERPVDAHDHGHGHGRG